MISMIIIAILGCLLSAILGSFLSAALFVAAYESKIKEFLDKEMESFFEDIKIFED